MTTISPLDIAKKFGEVLHMAEMYAYKHVNAPSTHKDGELPENIKSLLKSAATETSAFRFMATPFTRYMLVDKIIIQYIIRRVLRHDTFAGLDEQADAAIEANRANIFVSEYIIHSTS